MTTEETPRITVDDLRDKAMRIKDMAESEVRHVASERASQMIVVGVVAVVAAVSVAYYLGSRRCR